MLKLSNTTCATGAAIRCYNLEFQVAVHLHVVTRVH